MNKSKIALKTLLYTVWFVVFNTALFESIFDYGLSVFVCILIFGPLLGIFITSYCGMKYRKETPWWEYMIQVFIFCFIMIMYILI